MESKGQATVKFFITYWAPNGTSDLLICDADGQIIEFIDEAVFGCRAVNDWSRARVYNGDSVWALKCDLGDEERAYAEVPPDWIVYEVSFEELWKAISISPVSAKGGYERLIKIIGGA